MIYITLVRVREAISRKFRVSVDIVSIINVFGAEQFVQMSVSIVLVKPTLCVSVPCEQVQITMQNTIFPELSGSEIVQATTCRLYKPEQEFVFASAGTLDNPFSCTKECAAGFFQFQGLKSASCEQHSAQQTCVLCTTVFATGHSNKRRVLCKLFRL